MYRITFLSLILLPLLGCKPKTEKTTVPPSGNPQQASLSGSLVEARKGFTSKLVSRGGDHDPIPDPPADVFRKVKYTSPVGQLGAYVSPDPGDGKKHPAIIWITGGDCNSIDEVWKDAPADNDQTAAAYRKAGILMMFPSLRGGNNNPGTKEGFLGEVDDVLAACDFLAKQPYIDPARIYLGGHSTGGTLVLLVSECSDRFRAVFSFGPAAEMYGYDQQYLPFDINNPQEMKLRSPIHWMAGIKSPTFVIEGTVQGNGESLQAMASVNKNGQAHFIPAQGGTHFTILAPVNRLIARKILADTGPACNIAITGNEASSALR